MPTAPTGGTNGRLETRFGTWYLGQFYPLNGLGGSLMQDQAIGTVTSALGTYTYVPEVVPRVANQTASRVTTPLFGLGLVDAIPDQALILQGLAEVPCRRGVPGPCEERDPGPARRGTGRRNGRTG